MHTINNNKRESNSSSASTIVSTKPLYYSHHRSNHAVIILCFFLALTSISVFERRVLRAEGSIRAVSTVSSGSQIEGMKSNTPKNESQHAASSDSILPTPQNNSSSCSCYNSEAAKECCERFVRRSHKQGKF